MTNFLWEKIFVFPHYELICWKFCGIKITWNQIGIFLGGSRICAHSIHSFNFMISRKNSLVLTMTYLFSRHLIGVALDNVPKSITCDGRNAKWRHYDWKVLATLHELTQNFQLFACNDFRKLKYFNRITMCSTSKTYRIQFQNFSSVVNLLLIKKIKIMILWIL